MGLLNTIKFIIRHPLNQQNKSAAMLRFLKWQIASRLLDTDIIYPWINGVKVIVSNGETGFTQNIYCGLQ